MESKEETFRVLGESVLVRRTPAEDYKILIKVNDSDFEKVYAGPVLANAFRSYIGVIMKKAFASNSEEVRQLLNDQLLCYLIRFAAGWAHSFWNVGFQPDENQVADAWSVLKEYVANPLCYVPSLQPVKINFRVRMEELRLHTFPGENDSWHVIRRAGDGHATIIYS